ncbi:hypothetical protein EMCRGX_G016990 [Ephydatia muelleri]
MALNNMCNMKAAGESYMAGAFGIEITPSKDQVHVAFESVSGISTFTCSGNGARVVWSVNGCDATAPHVLNKGISVLPTVVSPDGRNVTARLLVPTIKSNNNTSVECTLLDASLGNPQSAGPVILLIQGILGPPDQLTIDVDFSNISLRLFWIAPPSYIYDVSPAAIFHYVLSNNVSNVPKIIKSSCAPSMPCNTSLDLSDPLLLMSHNTSILEYNGTMEFTFYAVNGAGNGNQTTYVLNIHVLQAVSAAMSVTGETVECDASASKYSYSAIFEYVTNALYPSDVSKEYKRGLRKRAAFFSVEAGHLYYSRRILEQGGLLDDFVIYAVLMLLRDQFPTMSGFQPTVLCQVKGFTPMNTDGIQIHYTDEEHWVTTALSDGSVFLYDSLVGNTETLPLNLKEQFSTVYKCAANDSALIVTQYPVQQQSGSTDCGLFSIAFAYRAAIGDNLRTLIFDQGRMRSHLLSCFKRIYGSICGASFVLIAGTVVFTVTYVKCKPKGNVMNIQMNRNDVYDEINKMAPPVKEEMEACPAYGLVL